MTAIVGILNKRAAVLAADSALTVMKGDRMKIYNTTTKIFQLSQDNHVAVMFFQNVDFMAVPWEVIFKLYHDKRGGKQFDTVVEYAEDFYQFLRDEKFFCSSEQQMDYLDGELATYYNNVKSAAISDMEKDVDAMDDDDFVNEEDLLRKHLKDCIARVDAMAKDAGASPGLEKVSEKEICSYGKDSLETLKEQIKEDDLPKDMFDDWVSGFTNYIRSRFYYNGTGIVFVGYGKNDIFPTLLPTYVSGAFNNRLRYYLDTDGMYAIGEECSASITPFAQSDVMITLMKGIAPNFYEKVTDLNVRSLSEEREKIASLLKDEGVDENVIKKVMDIDTTEIEKKHSESMDEYMQEEYIDGIVNAVESFNVEDMTNMAENLVSITSLQRHFSSSDETVGGPIDVAVITRAEGFTWVRHKDFIKNL